MYRYDLEIALGDTKALSQKKESSNVTSNLDEQLDSVLLVNDFLCNTTGTNQSQFKSATSTSAAISATSETSETLTTATKTISNNQQPLVLYVDSIQIYQETLDENDHHPSIDVIEHQRLDCEPPLLAINLPPNVLCLIDNLSDKDVDQKQKQQLSLDDISINGWEDILPKIHQSLTTHNFKPCILLRTSSKLKDETSSSTIHPGENTFDVLLLQPKIENIHKQIASGEDDENVSNHDICEDLNTNSKNGDNVNAINNNNKNCNNSNKNNDHKKHFKIQIHQTLNDIIHEINEEPMGISQSSVIQALPISNIRFGNTNPMVVVAKEGNTSGNCGESIIDNLHNYDVKKRPQDEDHTVAKGKYQRKKVIIPLCPVCRFRIEPRRLDVIGSDDSSSKSQQVCTHQTKRTSSATVRSTSNDNDDDNDCCINMEFLSPWMYPNYCSACHVIQERLNMAGGTEAESIPRNFYYQHQIKNVNGTLNNHDRLHCFKCGMKETLWVCLTCGVVGCGRYSHGHAESHYQQTSHPFSMELATQRIWDYATSSFVNREDLLNCNFMRDILGSMNRAAYINASSECGENGENGALSTYQLSDGTKPKKAAVVGEEYEILLQSALEDQAQHFDLEIAHLTAQLASEIVDKNRVSNEQMHEIQGLEKDITNLKKEVEILSREYIKIQTEEARHRAKHNSLLREQCVSKQVLEKIREDAAREHEEGKRKVEDLEQQISDLTANIKMRKQISQHDELSNAQIYGTLEKTKGSKKKGRRKSRK